MATSSFTSQVTVNRNSARSLSNILRKENVKPNVKTTKKIIQLKQEELKRLKFK